MSWCLQPGVWLCSSIRPVPVTEITLRDVEPAARAIGLQIQVLNASTSREINAAFATIVREQLDALFVGTDPFFTSRRVQFVLLATRHAVPATYPKRQYPEIGGLMSYGANSWTRFVRSASKPAASSRARSSRTCRSCSRPSSS